MNPELLFIMNALAGGTICSAKYDPEPGAGGGGGGGGAGGEPKPIEFSAEQQTKVNAIVAAERQKLEAKYKPLEERAKQVDDLSAQVKKLQEDLEVAAATGADKARIQAEQAAKKIAEEKEAGAKALATEKAGREKAELTLRSERVNRLLSTALVAAKAFPEALDDAVAALAGAAEIEIDVETGKLKEIRYGGVAYTDAKKAAEEFLKAKPYFAAGSAGGSGTPRPGGPPGVSGPNKMDVPTSELFRIGMSTDPR